MNVNRYIKEADILIEYINENYEKEWIGALDNISNDFIKLIESVPFSWFFTKGIKYIDIDSTVKGNLMEFDALKYKLNILKTRLDSYKEYSTEHISVEFEDLKKHIISEIRKSEKCINIAVAWLSDSNIISELNTAILRNVAVKILMLDCSSNINSSKAFEQRVEIKLANQSQKYKGNFMHNKFSIFDNNRVITGSYNWSEAAPFHDENIVIVFNDQIANQFNKQFNLLWGKYHKS